MDNDDRPLRVYLAGKITNHENDWRRGIVDQVGTVSLSRRLREGSIHHTTQSDDPFDWEWGTVASNWPGVEITVLVLHRRGGPRRDARVRTAWHGGVRERGGVSRNAVAAIAVQETGYQQSDRILPWSFARVR